MADGRSGTDQPVGESLPWFLSAVGYDTGLVAAAALGRLAAEYTSSFGAAISSLEHLGFVASCSQTIVHGSETLQRNARVVERIEQNSSAVYQGDVSETYKENVVERIAGGVGVTVSDNFRLKVRGLYSEGVAGKLCYFQRNMSSSVCLGARTVTTLGAHVIAGTLRVKFYGPRCFANAIAMPTNGLFHLEQYRVVRSWTRIKSEKIRLLLRNVGTLVTDSSAYPMSGRPLPPMPADAAAHAETSGFADESLPLEVVS